MSVEGGKTALQSARSVKDLSNPDECIRRWLAVGLPSGELGGDGVEDVGVVHCFQGSEIVDVSFASLILYSITAGTANLLFTFVHITLLRNAHRFHGPEPTRRLSRHRTTRT